MAAATAGIADARRIAARPRPQGNRRPPPTPGPTPTPTPTPGPPAGTGRQPCRLPRDSRRASTGSRAANRLPGTSVTITWPDGRSWTGTTGYADVKAGRAVTADTTFAIASMSKTFTAALILGLVDDGKLSLDTKVATILPKVRLGTPGQADPGRA